MKVKWIRTQAKVREFSKNFVVILCILWVVGAIFGAVIVWREPDNLSYLLDYIGTPMVSGVIGYMAKAALENREKIKKDEPTQPEP